MLNKCQIGPLTTASRTSIILNRPYIFLIVGSTVLKYKNNLQEIRAREHFANMTFYKVNLGQNATTVLTSPSLLILELQNMKTTYRKSGPANFL